MNVILTEYKHLEKDFLANVYYSIGKVEVVR